MSQYLSNGLIFSALLPPSKGEALTTPRGARVYERVVKDWRNDVAIFHYSLFTHSNVQYFNVDVFIVVKRHSYLEEQRTTHQYSLHSRAKV